MTISGLQNRKKLAGVFISLLLFAVLRWPTLVGTIWVNVGMIEINQFPAWRSVLFDVEMPNPVYVKQAIQYAPDNDALWRGWGMFSFAQGQTNEALAAWKSAGLDSNQVAVFQGQYAVIIEQYDAALAWFEYAVELNPEQAEVWHEIGKLRQQTGQAEAARASYGRALALRYADSADPLAKIWRSEGAYQMALEVWSTALDTFPKHPDRLRWWQGLTNSLRATEQWEGGVDMVEMALKEFPEDASLYVEYAALVYGYSGDVNETMNAVEKAIQLDASMIGAYSTAGSIMAAEQEYMTAYDWYAKAAERDAQNPSWLVAQGNMARAAGELSLALSAFETVIVRFPNFAPAHYGIALVYQQMGEKEHAVNAITQALQLMKRQDVQYYLRAGEIYEWGGNPVAAIATYRKVLDLDPDNKPVAAALQRLLNK